MKIEIIRLKSDRVEEFVIDSNKIIAGTVLLIMFNELLNIPVYANSVTQGLQPIINILKDLAEPVSYGFMIKGFLKIMSGDETEGYKTIKHAIGGYIGIQWIPMIYSLIKSIHF